MSVDFKKLLAIHDYEKLIKIHTIDWIAEVLGADISNVPPDGIKKYLIENYQEELRQAVKHIEVTYE